MGDAADILGIKAPEKKNVQFDITNLSMDVLPEKPKPAPQKRTLKQRELLLLTGTTQEAEDPSKRGFREKRKVVSKAVRWCWKKFRNSAREDGAVFGHWEKAREQRDDYIFSKYNVKMKVPTFTHEEYESLLKSDEWTFEDTSKLVYYFEKYNGRFVAIANYFSPETPIEELKHRYYLVERKVLEKQAELENTDTRNIPSVNYDKESEKLRRRYLEEEYYRSRKEVEEEETLIAESKRIEANQKREAKERERLSKMTAHIAGKGYAYYYTGDKIEGVMTEEDLIKEKIVVQGTNVRSWIMFRPLTENKRMRQYQDKVDFTIYQRCGKIKMCTPATVAQIGHMREDILEHVELQRKLEKKNYELQLVQNRINYLEKQKDKVDGVAEEEPPLPDIPSDNLSDLMEQDLATEERPAAPQMPTIPPRDTLSPHNGGTETQKEVTGNDIVKPAFLDEQNLARIAANAAAAVKKVEVAMAHSAQQEILNSNGDLPIPKLSIKIPTGVPESSTIRVTELTTPKSGTPKGAPAPVRRVRSGSIIVNTDDVSNGVTATMVATSLYEAGKALPCSTSPPARSPTTPDPGVPRPITKSRRRSGSAPVTAADPTLEKAVMGESPLLLSTTPPVRSPTTPDSCVPRPITKSRRRSGSAPATATDPTLEHAPKRQKTESN